MKRIMTVLLVSTLLYAQNGKTLFEKYCISCHTPFIPMSKLKENFLEYNNTLLKLKAPTLNQLSYRLKQRIGNPRGDEDMHRMEVTAFMSDYVRNPNKDKSVCLEEIIKHFKTMPSLKGKVKEEELEEIGTYLYDFDKKVLQEKSVQYENFDTALQKAKLNHKIVMIKAMSERCHFCRKMDSEVLIDKEVIKAIEKDFIPVSIDVSVHILPLGLKAQLTPSFIFVDENAKIIMNVPGAWNKQDFISLLKEAKNKSKDKR